MLDSGARCTICLSSAWMVARPSGNRSRVFGIGLNKTGTTTLGKALATLGFTHHQGFRRDLVMEYAEGRLDGILEIAAEYNNFEDWPWPLVYPELDEAFPGSKFVLTTRRSAEVWYESLCRHADRKSSETRRVREVVYGYGDPADRPDYFRRFYERHNAEARAHFASRPDDLLEICWEVESDWSRLAAFLGVTAPRVELPHENADPFSPGTNKERRRGIRDVLHRFLARTGLILS